MKISHYQSPLKGRMKRFWFGYDNIYKVDKTYASNLLGFDELLALYGNSIILIFKNENISLTFYEERFILRVGEFDSNFFIREEGKIDDFEDSFYDYKTSEELMRLKNIYVSLFRDFNEDILLYIEGL